MHHSQSSLFYFIFIPLIIATPQLNLHYTDGVSESAHSLQHDCLRAIAYSEQVLNVYEILSYCMSEMPSRFPVNNNILFSKFTFAGLSEQNITSEQLYLWSAPIDLIEHYQFYLNQLSTSSDLSSAEEMFYNCTIPRFGPLCQYELVSHQPDHSSLKQIIRDFYNNYDYGAMTNFTCYTHLQCYRGSSPVCLQWMEVCDGKIDCLDGGFDEVDCWQLEISECKDNEYRCHSGQCIPKSFYHDQVAVADCTDMSDERVKNMYYKEFCQGNDGPSFACEDLLAQNADILSVYVIQHAALLMKAMYSSQNSALSQECSSALKRLLDFHISEYSSYEYNECIEIVGNSCPEIFYFPNVPILFGDIYFAYSKYDFQSGTTFPEIPFYVCYDQSRYENYSVSAPTISFNNMTCTDAELFLPQWFFYFPSVEKLHIASINEFYKLLNRYHLIFNYTSDLCNKSSMYQCLHSSKCISAFRLMDGASDCPYMDDENITLINTTDVIKQLDKTHFKCPKSGKYIPQSFLQNQDCDCADSLSDWCEDEDERMTYLKTNIVFQHICDGFQDQLPVLIIDRNETDETECEQWDCNNTYTRCNNVWNCPNGADEAGCVFTSTVNCSSKQHLCVSPDTNQLTCLPIEKANDGHIDCLGATDEPQLCGTRTQLKTMNQKVGGDFFCITQTTRSCLGYAELCDNHSECVQRDDERFCINQTITNLCLIQMHHYPLSDIEMFLCTYRVPSRFWEIVHFTLAEMITSYVNQVKQIEHTILSSSSMIQRTAQYAPHCHRGLNLRVWLNDEDNSSILTCLCSPSYYGEQCQYQNQRVSLTVKFRALASSWQTLFAIVISLIDDSDQRTIHSYEQFTFLSVRDCQTKFNVYLLYSTRPKDPHKNYSVHIDIYEKDSFEYRGSLLFPVTYRFLPIYRLSVIVDIPRQNDKVRSCSDNQCVHGQCIRYSNSSQNDSFCKCEKRWSGQHCNIPHTCNCSLDSLCIGVSANNRSICICPIHKFGPRCLLSDTSCQTDDNSTCKNGGQCIPNNDYVIYNRKFSCICRQGTRGDRCEVVDNNFTLSFDKDIIPSQSIFIHFIEVIGIDSAPVRSTTFRTIPVKQDSIIIHWSRPFHLAFIEPSNKTYYLAIVQKIYNQSTSINKTIHSSDRCSHISEVLNETIAQWHLLRRIKYYHLACQTHSPDLQCFYDEVHLCLCYQFGDKRLANCFKFEHDGTSDCWGQSECENDGQCFQDKPNCPQRSICVCPSCFYGTRCELSTNGFGLSLDAILGYHIHPHLSLTDQPAITQVSLGLTVIFVVIGLINGILSLMTFKNKTVREVGCGLYLLGSSITTLLITIMFGLKYLILILTQMTVISNRSFLLFQCYSFDFILRVCLSMDQWLTACVAIERTITVIKKTSFVKKKSKQVAKFVITILLIVIIGTCIHDPVHRRLVDAENNNDVDDNQKRTWCIVSYSSGLEVYDYIIHIVHFFGPFLMNILSAVVIITKQARQKSNIHTDRLYRKHLREQYQEHRHLLIGPVALVILAIPRLIIAFVSKCMESANDAWLFLIGYFIAFIPPMLTFIVFVSPSEFYKEEFDKSMQQFRKIMHLCHRSM